MNYKLLIVESPTKAKNIQKYLGSEFKVFASYGHVYEIPSKRGSIDIEDNFHIKYQVPERSKIYLNKILESCKKDTQIFLATDPDREGEVISHHIAIEIENKKILKTKKQIQRITFNSINKESVKKAIENPRKIDIDLVNAQQARRALDYLVGFNLSPVLWRKIPGSMSAGRVQSVALRLICEKDSDIFGFKPEKYWVIHGKFEKKESFESELILLEGKKIEKFSFKNQKSVTEAVKKIQNIEFSVSEIKKKKAETKPHSPFTTSTLQQDASSKLGFNPKRTMQIAQKLYEGIKINKDVVGLITYMRTDGIYIDSSAIENIRSQIKELYGDSYLPKKIREYKNKIKNAQEAHEAIRPINFEMTPSKIEQYLTDEQFKLYDLIWRRTVASQMEGAIFDQTQVIISSKDSSSQFQTSGSILAFDGFHKIYSTRTKDNLLPQLKKGDALKTDEIIDIKSETKPPAHFSEASLIKKLEELGIGRPSTYTTILSVLQDRKYIKLENKKLISEDRGKVVNAFLFNFFTKYVDYNFTANLEDQLDEIANGKSDWIKVLQNFWTEFIKKINEVSEIKTEDVAEKLNKFLSNILFKDKERECPKCKKGVLGMRFSKFGVFIACNQYPECKHIENIDSNKGKLIDEKYPRSIGKDSSGREITISRGPYGLYLQMENDDAKMKNVQIPAAINEEMMDIPLAEKLLSLPMNLGFFPKTTKQIKIGLGKFGGYIFFENTYISIKNELELLKLTLKDAVQKIDEYNENLQKYFIKKIGTHEKGVVNLYKNRFFYFIIHDGKKQKLGKDKDFESITINNLIESKLLKITKEKKLSAKPKKSIAKITKSKTKK